MSEKPKPYSNKRERKRSEVDRHNYELWLRRNTVGQRIPPKKKLAVTTFGADTALLLALSLSGAFEVKGVYE